MTRLAVFDLDGTLVDSRQIMAASTQAAWETLGLEPPGYDDIRRIVGLSLLEAVRVLAPGLPEARHSELSTAYRAAFLKNREAGMDEPLYAGARETIAALHADGWLLGVATGKSRHGIERIFETHGVGHLFTCAFCADDGPGKPDPHMLRLNIDAAAVASDAAVMIGDTSHDMVMARNAGVYGLGVSWGFHTADEVGEHAHEVAHDFAALNAALARWRTA